MRSKSDWDWLDVLECHALNETERGLCSKLRTSWKREEELRDGLESMVYQFAYQTSGPAFHTGGLSALEEAFELLGWSDPHPCPEQKCETDECREHATCGTPTPDGYKRLCGDHYMALTPRKEST